MSLRTVRCLLCSPHTAFLQIVINNDNASASLSASFFFVRRHRVPPEFRNRVAHGGAHDSKTCVVPGVYQLTEDVGDNDFAGDTWENLGSKLTPHWHPLTRAHFRTSRCPPSAALLHVDASHGQSCLRAYFKTLRCPCAAAAEEVFSSQGMPILRNHLSASRFPSAAAFAHVGSLLEAGNVRLVVITMLSSAIKASFKQIRDMNSE